MGVAAKQTAVTGKRKTITVTVSSEADVRKYRDFYPGYQMTRTNLGPNSIKLTFTRA